MGDVARLANGLYELTWKHGHGTSLAAVGRNSAGAAWFAATNWTGGIECYDWYRVESVRPIPPVRVAPDLDPDVKAMLLHALETGETAPLHDYLTERNGDPDFAAAVRANVRREIAREIVTKPNDGYYQVSIPPDFWALVGATDIPPEPRVWTPPPDNPRPSGDTPPGEPWCTECGRQLTESGCRLNHCTQTG